MKEAEFEIHRIGRDVISDFVKMHPEDTLICFDFSITKFMILMLKMLENLYALGFP